MSDCPERDEEQEYRIGIGISPFPLISALSLATACFLLFVGFTVGFVTWQLHSTEEKFCTLMVTLSKPPAPTSQQASQPNASARKYTQELSKDIHQLKEKLGC
jgi:hypothetical protein